VTSPPSSGSRCFVGTIGSEPTILRNRQRLPKAIRFKTMAIRSFPWGRTAIRQASPATRASLFRSVSV
jgi:hypothetical protein